MRSPWLASLKQIPFARQDRTAHSGCATIFAIAVRVSGGSAVAGDHRHGPSCGKTCWPASQLCPHRPIHIEPIWHSNAHEKAGRNHPAGHASSTPAMCQPVELDPPLVNRLAHHGCRRGVIFNRQAFGLRPRQTARSCQARHARLPVVKRFVAEDRI